jgi:hypothetical protein
MKYFVIFLILIGITSSAFAQNIGDSEDKMWLPACPKGSQTECDQSSLFHPAISKPFAQSDSVAIGTIVQKETTEQNTIQYSINVDFYLKNHQPFDLLTATLSNAHEPQTFPEVLYYNSPVFNGDLVFVYLTKNGGQYDVLPVSFALDKRESRGPPPTIQLTKSPSDDNFMQGDKIFVSGEVRKMELVKAAKEGENLDAKLRLLETDDRNNVVFSDLMEIMSDGSYNYKLDTTIIPPGKYELEVNYGPSTYGNGITIEPNFQFWFPLRQFNSGISIDEIQCKENLVLIQKHNGSPACVKPETKIKLVERGWVKTTTLQEIDDSSDSLNLNIARIEDGRISLHPENTCASLDLNRLTAQDIQRYKNDEKGLDENNILQITSKDLKEIPDIQELIYAVHSIEFPYNKYSSASLDGMTFVEYELFLMDKSMKKYGDSKGDYFKKLDGDYEERFTNPAKQGFTNHFEAPVILYNDDAYSVSGTYFWTSDEHEPRRMSFFPIDDINDDEKFITLTDEDMKSVPKIKDAIASIGTIKESVSASKGLPEDQWNQYREWFKQKSQDSLNSDRFRLIQYDNHLYSIGFGIC